MIGLELLALSERDGLKLNPVVKCDMISKVVGVTPAENAELIEAREVEVFGRLFDQRKRCKWWTEKDPSNELFSFAEIESTVVLVAFLVGHMGVLYDETIHERAPVEVEELEQDLQTGIDSLITLLGDSENLRVALAQRALGLLLSRPMDEDEDTEEEYMDTFQTNG